jgi:hypothetical protein
VQYFCGGHSAESIGVEESGHFEIIRNQSVGSCVKKGRRISATLKLIPENAGWILTTILFLRLREFRSRHLDGGEG